MNLSSIMDFHNDGSPFDSEKNYNYTHFNDYLVHKSKQLYENKNWFLTQKEIEGIKKCQNFIEDDFFCNSLESSLVNIKKIDEVKLELNKVKSLLEDETEISDFSSIVNTIFNLIKDLEVYEYHHFLEEIVENKLKEINSSSSNKKEIIELINIISSFSPLNYLIEIAKIRNKKEKTFFLFDLDATLFDNSPRVHKIINDFIKSFSDKYPEEIEKMKKIKRKDIVWGMKNILSDFGIDIKNEAFMSDVIKFWYLRFFSNSYIIDTPLKGSIDFIKKLEQTGTQIVYLTGRFESMREGTSRNIREYGFPLDKNGTNLVLKPHNKIEDHVFKHTAMEDMRKFGNLIAGFDNEPINVNIFKQHFETSHIFFLETNHSPNPPNLIKNIHTIRNFVI